MKNCLKIFLIILFLSASAGFAQVRPAKNKTRKAEPVTETRNVGVNKEDDKKTQNKGTKEGSVKQVKSARPDMSKSRGARPPDIVRPSGSRIPKGVGRPAGAMRHGRG